jgi:hypothetical protein
VERSDLFAAAGPVLVEVLEYLLRMTGLSVSQRCTDELRRAKGLGFEFSIVDLVDSDVRVKHLNVSALTQFIVLHPLFIGLVWHPGA